MKPLLLLITLALPLCLFAQGPNTNINPVQAKNINYIIQVINDDNNINQQSNPPIQQQQRGGAGTLFGSKNANEPCTDCDKVKKAIRLSHAGSGGNQHKRTFRGKKWSRTFAGKMNMRMKKAFSRSHKVKTSYSLCFNWH